VGYLPSEIVRTAEMKEEIKEIKDLVDKYHPSAKEEWADAFDPEGIETIIKGNSKPQIGDLRVTSQGIQFCNKVINGKAYWSDLNI
jgi:16S rRNA C967 or C1407 C5-methylase (RsmB/RsmF family)